MPNPPNSPVSTALIPYRADQGLYSRTRYLPEYAGQMLTYFSTTLAAVMAKYEEKVDQEMVRMQDGSVQVAKMTQKGSVRAITGDLPTFERFAHSIGITKSTLLKWAGRFAEFNEAYQRCCDLQKDFLVQGLLTGRIPSAGGIFVAKNLTDMRDDSSLTLHAAPTYEKPVLADKSKAELLALKELVEKSAALGLTVSIDMADKSDPDGADEEWAESGINQEDRAQEAQEAREARVR